MFNQFKNEYHTRRFSAKYKKKKELVKNVWIAWGIAMTVIAIPAFVCASSLFFCFVSFCILDETV